MISTQQSDSHSTLLVLSDVRRVQLIETITCHSYSDQTPNIPSIHRILSRLFPPWTLSTDAVCVPSLVCADRLLNTIQINCPHILRYLTAAAILHKRRKNVIKDLIRVLLQSTHDVLPPLPASIAATAQPSVLTSSPTSLSYNDPLISFLLSLYTDFSFSTSHAHLQQCRVLLANDFFLAGPMERELIETGRVLLFEVYTSIHSRVAIDTMAGEVDLSKEVKVDKDGEIMVESEEEEKRRVEASDSKEASSAAAEEKTGGGGVTDDNILVSLLRACHVNGRIDSFNGPSAHAGRRAIGVPAGHRSNTQCGVSGHTDGAEHQQASESQERAAGTAGTHRGLSKQTRSTRNRQ